MTHGPPEHTLRQELLTHPVIAAQIRDLEPDQKFDICWHGYERYFVTHLRPPEREQSLIIVVDSQLQFPPRIFRKTGTAPLELVM